MIHRFAALLIFLAHASCGDVATISDQAAETSANYKPVSLSPDDLLAVTVNVPYKEVLKVNDGLYPLSFSLVKGVLPPGLKFDQKTGIIDGIVKDSEAAKQYSFTIRVDDANGVSDEQSFGLKINPYKFVLGPDELPPVVINSPYLIRLEAIGAVEPINWEFVGDVQSGFSLDPNSGVLKIDSSIVFTRRSEEMSGEGAKLTVRAKDKNGVEITKPYVVTLQTAGYVPVQLVEADLMPVVPDAPYKEIFSIAGGSPPYAVTIVKGDLPKGLELDAETGTISGTVPSASVSNLQYVLQMQVTDGLKKTDEKVFKLVIKPYQIVISPADLPDVVPMTPYGLKLGTVGGVGPFTFSIVGETPPRIKLAADGSLLTTSPHVPLSAASTEWPVDITVTDAKGMTGKLKTKIKVGASPANSAPLTIQSTSLPTVVAGVSYSAGIVTTGGVAPLKFQVQSGSFPQGITLSEATGVLSGTPLVSSGGSQFAVIVKVSDATGEFVVQSFAGLVSQGSSVLKILSDTLSTPVAGGTYASVVAATGGQQPYVFTIQSGTLPQGLTLNSSNGTIGGTVAPNLGGVGYLFSVSVTDATNQVAVKTYSGSIQTLSSPLTFQTSSLATMVAGSAYSSGISVTGGVAPITFAVESGFLPTGLNLAAPTGLISGSLSFATANMSYAAVISATDATGQKVTRTFTGGVTSGSSTLSISTTTLATPNAGSPYAAVVSVTGGIAPYQFTLATGSLPTGLALSSTTGVISGVPSYATAQTAYVFTVSVSDASGQIASKAYSGTVGSGSAPLAIQTSSIMTPGAGNSYLQLIAATGGVAPYTFSLASGALPSGLTLNPSSGMISGTVAFSSRNNPYLFSILLTDSQGTTTTQAYSGFVSDYSVSLMPTTLTPPTPGAYYTTTILVVGGQSPYTFALTTGILPVGLSLNASTGTISGTVSDSEAGLTKTVIITATDAHGALATRTYAIATASFAVTLTNESLSGAIEGQTYNNGNQNLTASGGSAPYTFEYSGSLPSGVGLTSSGQFFGTPAQGTGALSGGTNYAVSIRVRDSANRVSQAYSRTINVGLSLPVVGAAAPPVGTLGTFYSHSLSATGGRPSYSFSLHSGSLPSGLALQTNGVISGTPTSSVSCPAGNFRVKVTDSLAQESLVETKCIATVTGVSISSTTFPTVITGVNYSATVLAQGGSTPYSFIATGLPNGVTLNPNSGVLSGYANAETGDYTAYITVSDQSTPALSTTRSYVFKVRDPLVIATASVNRAGSGIVYNTVNFSGTGGEPPYSFTLTSGALPAGLTLSTSGALAGTPLPQTSGGSGTYSFTVTATDQSGLTSPAKSYTLYVTRGPKIKTQVLPAAIEGRLIAYQVEHTGGVNQFISTTNLASRLTWAATGLPPGLSIDSASGRISGAPAAGSSSGSPYSVTLSVTDQYGFTGSKTVSMQVRTTGATFNLDLPRMVEPCESGSNSNCETIAHAVGALVPSVPDTKYVVYGAVTAGTSAAPTSSRIYIARVLSDGSIATPGTSNLTLSYTPTAVGFITGLDIGDIDNDSYPDIVFSDRTANTIVVVWNSGTTNAQGMPVFSSQSTFNMPAGGARPMMVKVRQLRPDATNSNKKDLIVADYDLLTAATPGRVVVFLAQDACSSNCSASRSTVYTGTGASIVAQNTTLITPAVGLIYIGGVETGYFKTAPGAGVCPSIVVTGRRSNNSEDYIFLRHQSFTGGKCTGNFSDHTASDEKLITPASQNGIPSSPAVADFDNDGISDIATVYRWGGATSSANVKVYMMPGGNLFPANPLSPTLPFFGTSLIGGAIIPYCTDGSTACTYPGLLVAGGRDRGTWVAANGMTNYGFLSFIPNQRSSPWFEDNTGNNRIDYEAPNGVGVNGIVATPLVTPNRNDILMMGVESNGYPFYYMAPRNANSTSEPLKITRMMQSEPSYLANDGEVGSMILIDINNDNMLELITHQVNSAAIAIHQGELDKNGPGNLPQPVMNPIGSNFGLPNSYHYQYTMATGDFNEDGYPDFATVGNTSRVITVNFGDGTTVVGNSVMLEPGVSGELNPRMINVSDYDGDGHDDIMVFNLNLSLNNYSMAFLKGNGNGTFMTAQEFMMANAVCADSRSMISRDLNGDSRPEIAILCYSAQSLFILRRHADTGGTWIRNGVGSINPVGSNNGTTLAAGFLTSTTGTDFVVGGLDVTSTYRIINGVQLTAPDINGAFNVTVGSLNPYKSLRGYLSTVEIGDLDADGYGDIILAMSSQAGSAAALNAHLFYTCLTTAAGNCNTLSWGGYGPGMTSIGLGDVDNNGLLDIFVGTRTGGRLPFRMIVRGINRGYW